MALSLGILVLSLIAFVLVLRHSILNTSSGRSISPSFIAMMLEEAKLAYESGGASALVERMEHFDKYLSGKYHLTDANGRDLATGEDWSSSLELLGYEWNVWKPLQGNHVLATTSSDDRYRMIAMLPPRYEILPFIPYYVLILLAIGTVCWVLALNVASPLRKLALAVDGFGRGDLSIRVNSSRRDEIGALGMAFDGMAARIEKLVTSERRLLQDVSHELRSPLARLRVAAELVRTDHDREASVCHLIKEIDRLTHLVSALLEVAREEDDTSFNDLKEIRLDTILSEVVEDCRLEARARGCCINFGGNQHIATTGNGELLRRAVENIVRNAIYYTPQDSAVDVNLEATEGIAKIAVRDYGPGVPEDLLRKIFEPFFRTDESRSDSTGGVGLGLSIAHRAIALHHGHLWAKNANPGLLLQIELPLEPEHGRPETATVDSSTTENPLPHST